MRYCKKPIIVEAVQWNGANKVEIQQFMNRYLDEYTDTHGLVIPTLEGNMVASLGDYIIKGIDGEFYPCKPDIFDRTYEIVDDNGETRAVTLLKAVFDLLHKQIDSPYILNILDTLVFYDDVDCDGYCLMEDIKCYLDEISVNVKK